MQLPVRLLRSSSHIYRSSAHKNNTKPVPKFKNYENLMIKKLLENSQTSRLTISVGTPQYFIRNF
ncbi:hypothetical protein B0192_03200 [Leptospira interrogans serovar Australis]|nr:hypothetical protein B0192_03200 [Leptospira interrogans serovar Australis]